MPTTREMVVDALERRCVVCGYDTDIRVLQVTYKNGSIKHERSKQARDKWWDRVMGMLDQFELLCANCKFRRMYDRCSTTNKNSRECDEIVVWKCGTVPVANLETGSFSFLNRHLETGKRVYILAGGKTREYFSTKPLEIVEDLTMLDTRGDGVYKVNTRTGEVEVV